jgi:hypothetical protein
MKLRILLACRISKRLAREARSYRRALRDHLRNETAQIRKLEIRSRGLGVGSLERHSDPR